MKKRCFLTLAVLVMTILVSGVPAFGDENQATQVTNITNVTNVPNSSPGIPPIPPMPPIPTMPPIPNLIPVLPTPTPTLFFSADWPDLYYHPTDNFTL